MLFCEHRCIHTHQKIEIQFRRQYWKQFEPESNLARAEIAQKNDSEDDSADDSATFFSSFYMTGAINMELTEKLILNLSSCHFSQIRG